MRKIVVVKIGTNTLTRERGGLNLGVMQEVAEQIKELQERDFEVILVSSGAVGSGMRSIGIEKYPTSIELKQLCAAAGQAELMRTWQMVFGNTKTSQHLLTHATFDHKKNSKDFKNCLLLALEKGIVPIVNENDAISTEEIDEHFTDNDELAIMVAGAVSAKRVIILSDISGLYDANPKENPNAKLIKEVRKINEKILTLASGKSSKGRGGMEGKLKAIARAMEQNIEVFLTYGGSIDAILNTFEKDFRGTIFKK
ncbi:MAG: glutamate 5-kinase [Candidatus Moranbacteria bacterium]|nr:glutamate 5-kinase [Candidatus Moranbacteria bacterium]